MRRKALLGIDIGGTNIKLAIVSPNGRVISRGILSTNQSQGAAPAFKKISQAFPLLCGTDHVVIGAGISCAGLIDRAKGRVLSSPNLPGFDGARLSVLAGRYLGVPTVIENDANAAAYGEYRCGSGKKSKCLICVTMGTGIGGGIVIDGSVLRGAKGFAGEVGHMTIDEKGPRCKCGNRGCLEAFVGATALVKQARAMLKTRKTGRLARIVRENPRSLSTKLIADMAVAGDRSAKRLLEDASRHLGCATASLINIFNPDVVVYSGGVANALPLMMPGIEKEVRLRTYLEKVRRPRIAHAMLGNDAATVGAAMMIGDELL